MTDQKKYLKDLKGELDNYGTELTRIKKQFGKNTTPKTQKIVDSLQDILKEATTSYDNLKNASSAEWEPIKKIANAAFKDLQGSFEDFLNDSLEKGKDYVDQAQAYSEEHMDQLAEYVKKNPLKSILWAAAAGFLIGKVTK